MPYNTIKIIKNDHSGSSYLVSYSTGHKTEIPKTMVENDPSTWIEVPYGCFIQTSWKGGLSLSIPNTISGSTSGSTQVMRLHQLTTLCPAPCPKHSNPDIPWGIFDTFWNYWYELYDGPTGGVGHFYHRDDEGEWDCGCDMDVPQASSSIRG